MLKNPLLITLLILLLSGCADLKKLANVQKPTLSMDDFRVTGISLQDVELTFDLMVTNPNPVSLSLASYNYDLQIEESSFVKGNQALATKIEANGSNIISIPVTFTFKELYNTFKSINGNKEGDYKFLANVGVDVPVLGLLDIPIQKEGSFPIVKAPTISLSKFSVKSLSFTKADVELELNIENPNTFGLNLNELNYKVDFNGFNSIEGNTSNSVSIAENEIGTIKVPASFNFLELGTAAYSALVGGKPFQYSLTGTADIGATLPYFNSSSFNFDKSGVVDILK